MIEVFPEKDYNCLIEAVRGFDVSVKPDSSGMVMREDGVIGAALWTEADGAADIYAVVAPDTCGAYFDLIIRSTLNHLIKSGAAEVRLGGGSDFLTQFGFTADGQKMIVQTDKIIFPHHCKTGGR